MNDSSDFPAGYAVVDPHDPLEVRMGPFYRPLDDGGDPRVCFKVEPRHLNRSGVVHGGLLMTMADVVLCTASVHDIDEERTITVSLNSEFVDAAELGDFIEGRGEVIRRTGSLVFVRGTLTAGERVLVTSSAVIKRIPRK